MKCLHIHQQESQSEWPEVEREAAAATLAAAHRAINPTRRGPSPHPTLAQHPIALQTGIQGPQPAMSFVQRLRQGQGRAQQQLLSLVQWHQQAQAAGGALGARGFAEQPPTAKFAKDRAAYERSLSQLRKEWAQKRLEREAAKAAAEETARCGSGRRRRQAAAVAAWLVACLACLHACGKLPCTCGTSQHTSVGPSGCPPHCRSRRAAPPATSAAASVQGSAAGSQGAAGSARSGVPGPPPHRVPGAAGGGQRAAGAHARLPGASGWACGRAGAGAGAAADVSMVAPLSGQRLASPVPCHAPSNRNAVHPSPTTPTAAGGQG